MSLIHWWPLNGDTRDKITGTTLTNNGATLTTAKTGQGYFFDGTSGYCLSQSYNQTISSNSFSFAFWIKLGPSWKTWGKPFIVGTAGTSWSPMSLGVGIRNDGKIYFSVSNGSQYLGISGPYHKLTLEEWYHVICTYENGEMALYINGAPATGRATAQTTVVPSLSSATIINIGGESTWTGESTICDVRVYDHALSLAEAKELAKALVCHYKLDACNNTNLLLNQGRPSFNDYLSKAAGKLVYDEILCQDVFECSNSTTKENFVFYSNRFSVVGNEPYIFSCDVYCNSYLKSLDVYFLTSSTVAADSTATSFDSPGGIKYFSRSTTTSEKLIPGQWVHISSTLTPASGQISGFIRIDNNGTSSDGTAAVLRVANCKLERGPKATPFGVHPNETPYKTTEPDCSGFGNDGTKYGTLAYRSDSIFNSSCTVFPGTAGNYINCGKGGKVRDAITVNWWGYMDSWSSYGRAISCTEGGGWNFEPSGGKMAFACGTGTTANVYKNVASTKTLAELSAGWHMFTGTYDGKATKIYIDGNLEGTNNAYTTKTLLYYADNSIFLGIEAQGGANNPTSPYFNGRLSDVRIYGTALSLEDIQRLYRTRACVSDKKDTISGAFIEDSTRVAIDSAGQFFVNEVYEDIYANSEVAGIAGRVSYVDTNTTYFDTGIAADENTRIVIDCQVIDTRSGWIPVFGGDNYGTNGVNIVDTAFGVYAVSTSSFYIYFGGDAKASSKAFDRERHIFELDKNGLQIDGELVANVEKVSTRKELTVPLHLGGFWRNGGVSQGNIRIYSCQIYQNGRLIANYVPSMTPMTPILWNEKMDAVVGPNGMSGLKIGQYVTVRNKNLILPEGNICGREIIET